MEDCEDGVMSTKDFTTDTHTVGEHWNRIFRNERGYDGVVVTPFGIVDVTCEEGSYPYTTMILVYDGAVHCRHWAEAFSKRTLVTLAKRFAKEICE